MVTIYSHYITSRQSYQTNVSVQRHFWASATGVNGSIRTVLPLHQLFRLHRLIAQAKMGAKKWSLPAQAPKSLKSPPKPQPHKSKIGAKTKKTPEKSEVFFTPFGFQIDVQIWRKGQDSNLRGVNLPVFKTGALNHSATLPRLIITREWGGGKLGGGRNGRCKKY